MKLVRISEDYGIAIAKSGDQYFIFKNGRLNKALTEQEAIGYSSGVADGMGFAGCPPYDFADTKAIEHWLISRAHEYAKSNLKPRMTNESLGRLVRKVLASRKIQPRRPYDDDRPDGYLESDNDFFQNNYMVVIDLMEALAGVEL